ncbi:MAG: hemolysin family protein [Chloroflexota bacterium]|nr:hemolysin family protein [Chloroflexota bacterium]
MPFATLEIIIIILLIIANGVFAMSETAFVSARKVRLQQRANEGDLKAAAALELAKSPNRLLSTVQLGITLIGILAGAFGGATVAQAVAVYIRAIPWLAPYSDGVALTAVVAGITYLSLVIGELVPKRIALNNPERIAIFMVTPMRTLSTIASPFIHLLSISTEGILRLIGLRPSGEPPITEAEINVLIEEGTQIGTFEAAEQDMIERIFRMGNRRVNSLMTHRPDIVWLEAADTSQEIRQVIRESNYSRFPVCHEGLDNVLGMVHVKDLLLQCMAGQPFDVKAVLQEPLYVIESTSTLKVLESFKKTGKQAALVIQEYGDIQGLITLNDILEAIVGDISSTGDLDNPQAVQREDGSWLFDGMLPIDEFKDILHIRALPEEASGDYETLAGFVLIELGRVPIATDHFEWGTLRFEVVDMDGRRIDKVLVQPIKDYNANATN